MNDASVKRIDQHLLTTADGRARGRGPSACARWSCGRRGSAATCPGLPAALRRDGLVVAHTYGGLRTLWLRPGMSDRTADGRDASRGLRPTECRSGAGSGPGRSPR